MPRHIYGFSQVTPAASVGFLPEEIVAAQTQAAGRRIDLRVLLADRPVDAARLEMNAVRHAQRDFRSELKVAT